MHTRSSAAAAAAALFFALTATTVSATTVRTFVSGKGSDANACSLAAPCRTFTGALAQTGAGGEIVVLDSAGFGAVTIDKPVTISNQSGVEGGITVNSGNGITVNLATGGDVTLKGLTIDGAGTADRGVMATYSNPGTLSIINCTVRGFLYGLRATYAGPSVTVPEMKMLVLDSNFTNNKGYGVYVENGAAVTRLDVLIRNSIMDFGAQGLTLDGHGFGNVAVIARDIDVSENSGVGIRLLGTHDFLELHHSTVVQNHPVDMQTDSGGSNVVYLFDHNAMGQVTAPQGSVFSDGTNAGGAPPGGMSLFPLD